MTNLFAWNQKNILNSPSKDFCRYMIFGFAIAVSLLILPEFASATVESSLESVQRKISFLLPLVACCAIGFAGLSFALGHPNARRHFFYAILGCIIGFGSESIILFIRQLIR